MDSIKATGKSDANKSTPSNDEEGCVLSAAAAANKSGNVPSPTPPLLMSATTGTSSITPASTPPSEGVSPTQQQQHQQQRSSSSFAASAAAAGPNPMLAAVDLTTTLGGGGGASSSSLAIKILVSNNVAGSIIGRSGQTINDLQEQSSSRIKLSQSGDCYPGTTDRVCLVQGTADNVKTATGLVLQKTYESQQQQGQTGSMEDIPHATPLSSSATSAGPGVASHTSQTPQPSSSGKSAGSSRYVQTDSSNKQKPTGGNNNPSQGFLFVVRILVPIPSCGMLIGRGGTNIKYMLDVSGVSSIRLSRKEGDIHNLRPSSHHGGGGSSSSTASAAAAAVLSATSERVVTISGPSLESCISCVSVILDGMAAHPEISRYVNMSTSYSRAVSAAQSAIGAAQAAAAVQGGRIGSHPPHSSPSSGPTIPGYALGSPPTEPSSLGGGGGLQPGPSMGMVQQGTGRIILTQQQQQQHPQHTMNRGMLSVTEGLRGPLSPSSRFFESRMSGSELAAPTVGQPGSSFPIMGTSPSSSIATGTTTSTAVTSATTHHPSPQQQQQPPTSTASSMVPAVAVAPSSTHAPPRTSSSSLYESSPFMEQPPGGSIQGTWHPDFAAPPTATGTTTGNIIPSSSSPPSTSTGAGGGGPGRSSWGSSAAAVGIVGTSPPQGQAPSLLQTQQQQHARNLAADPTNRVGHYPHHVVAHTLSAASSFEQQQQPSAQMAIPDVLIGSILGRGGRTLHQLQLASNCRIRISQRGVFVPGTVNRVVTMTGPTAESVSVAQFLIRQRLMEHNQMGNTTYNATNKNNSSHVAPPATVPPTPSSTAIVEHTNYHHHTTPQQSHHRASPQQQQPLQQHHPQGGGGYLNYYAAPMQHQQQGHDPNRYLSHGSAGTREGDTTDAPDESSKSPPGSDPNLSSTSQSPS